MSNNKKNNNVSGSQGQFHKKLTQFNAKAGFFSLYAHLKTILLILIVLFLVFSLFLSQTATIRTTAKHEYIEIPNGATIKKIATILYDNQIIQYPNVFYFLGRILTINDTLKRGFYSFNIDLSWYQLFNLLKHGQNAYFSLVILEGWTAQNVIDALKESDIKNNKDYERLMTSKDLITYSGFSTAKNLEGFFFPDTYYLPLNLSEFDILKIFISNFKRKLPANFEQQASDVGLSPYEAIILASIIEKESYIPAQQKIISSVFHNRLKKGMRLQADPTVIYGSGKFGKPITKKDLRTKTPYNTYVIDALPPTPISNPGLSSILAAINPEQTDYLYFVAKGKGLSYFSKTLREHNKAVYRYQR